MIARFSPQAPPNMQTTNNQNNNTKLSTY